jgi:hypothetical protein
MDAFRNVHEFDDPDAPEIVVEGVPGEGLFIVIDGVRVAQRGLPGTLQAKAWVSLEPGYFVHDTGWPGEPGYFVTISYEAPTVQ